MPKALWIGVTSDVTKMLRELLSIPREFGTGRDGTTLQDTKFDPIYYILHMVFVRHLTRLRTCESAESYARLESAGLYVREICGCAPSDVLQQHFPQLRQLLYHFPFSPL